VNRRSCDNNRALFGGRSNRQPRAAITSPPWVCKPRLQRQRAGFPVSRSHTDCTPRGAYAPRSWRFARCRVAGEMTPFAMHKRTFTRAAGVSPPWFGFALATAAGFCGLITFRPAHSLPVPRLAYASRSWLHARHIACDVRFRFATADVPHGGLTPPALGLRCAGLPKQKRFLLCANARFRERRTSARRGCVNRRSCDNNRALFGGRSNRQSRAAGVSPPWVCKPRLQRQCAGFPVSRSHTDCTPRGAYAPRSWVHARHIACDVRFRFATADVPHGGLTPPALGLRCQVCRSKNDFCYAQTHVFESGDRQPAVGA
jgi:hypothetical protein